ncbi:MAG: hypothetical protein F6K25_07190 [Okeania sp. SIO2G4]|uniref:hypothetical protein n=1 Tax=unclassified Okeania TaxID=2634635 RepID=UPI0013B76A08|nr:MULTISPECIES: hypothetical protein [unclassified Okeania]NEP72233.1 hypothetical protein [Okeania sp. SIO2G5]NEP92249.1 hypothetical protein [Okeania sp. SIO2F5]NEQ90513.1 hypothetical protein [Okeania sp. SIO2G4]
MDDLNLTFMQIQPGSTISGIVAGFVDNGEDFTLNFSGGSTIVDTSPLDANQLGLNIGDPVNVLVAEFDGLEIDTIFMTRPDNSIILGSQTPPLPAPPQAALDPITGGIANPPSPVSNPVIPPQGNPIFGTVVGIVDNDEFLLQDANGTQILVDTNLPDNQFLSLVPGEQVNVTGIFDDNDFEAFSVTRPDGSLVFTAPPASQLFGTVVGVVDNNEFLLQDANGTQILVDTDLPNSQFLNLVPGEQVNLVGNFDDDDFDAFSVTRLDGSPVFTNTPVFPPAPVLNPVLPPPPVLNPVIPPQGNPIFGTVVGIVDNDEFLLQDGNGTQILVDADLPDNQFLNLVPGEQVNVVGIFDNDNFDAFSITRPDGSVIFSNTPTLEPPPEFNPVIPPQGNPIFSNTPILPPPPEFNPIIPPQGNPIFGTVAGIVDNDEFFWYDDDDDESFWDDNDRDDD